MKPKRVKKEFDYTAIPNDYHEKTVVYKELIKDIISIIISGDENGKLTPFGMACRIIDLFKKDWQTIKPEPKDIVVYINCSSQGKLFTIDSFKFGSMNELKKLIKKGDTKKFKLIPIE